MVMEMSLGSSFSFLLWGMEEFSIGLKDYLAFILFTHVNVSMQGGVEGFHYRNFSCFSTTNWPIACLLLTSERLEVSVDMLKVSSEGKNVFVVLAKYMIRLSRNVSEIHARPCCFHFRLSPWRLLLLMLCLFVLSLHVGFLSPPALQKRCS